jgi:ligand-binding sensor domain-containing protein
MRAIPRLAFLVTCGCAVVGGSAGGDVGWTSYTTEDGLTADRVGGLAVAPNGDVWCAYLVHGTGLSCFNGEEWVSHAPGNGLPAGDILWTGPLAIAPDGAVWVGMFGDGVCMYDGERWTAYTVADGLLSNKIATVAVGTDGAVWCGHGIEDGGLSKFDGGEWTNYRAADTGGLGRYPVLSIMAGPGGKVCAGADGVACYDGETWRWYPAESGMGTPVALSLAREPDGTLWIGGSGVTSYDGEEWRHYSFGEMGIDTTGEHGATSLAVAPDGTLWVGAGDLGAFSFDGEEWTRYTSADGLVDDSVMAIAVASDGAVWCGTEGGISRHVPAETPRKK